MKLSVCMYTIANYFKNSLNCQSVVCIMSSRHALCNCSHLNADRVILCDYFRK